jgi:NADH-quinone oxidoreductase subunit J
MSQFFFYALSAIAIGASLLMIFSRNTMYSVLFLLLGFFAVAGLYIMLNAEFLAIVHIIVYAGAIMVLFLYVLMFINMNFPAAMQKSNLVRLAAIITGGMIFLVLFASLWQTQLPEPAKEIDENAGSVQLLGQVLFNDFLIPFELSSILFISAMVGVMILTKKEQQHE